MKEDQMGHHRLEAAQNRIDDLEAENKRLKDELKELRNPTNVGWAQVLRERDEAWTAAIENGKFIYHISTERDAALAKLEKVRADLERLRACYADVHGQLASAEVERNDIRNTLSNVSNWAHERDRPDSTHSTDGFLTAQAEIREILDAPPGVVQVDPEDLQATIEKFKNSPRGSSGESKRKSAEWLLGKEDTSYDIIEREVVLCGNGRFVNGVEELYVSESCQVGNVAGEIARATVQFKVPRQAKASLADRLEYLLRTGKQMPGTDSTLVDEVRTLEARQMTLLKGDEENERS